MQNNLGKIAPKPVVDHGLVGERSSARQGNRAHRSRYLPVILAAMIIAPMILVLGLTMTAPARAYTSPAPVNLGTAGNFVILAKTGISTTGATHVVGDIGVSPIDSTAITGFGLVYTIGDPSATSSLVTGLVYAADYAAPTPTMLTTAVGDMQTAYTNAAGRVNPDATELGAGDITSMILAPGLYKWSSTVSVGATGVTISGGASEVWIFQIAQDLTVADGANVYLAGGAVASNIFWQVAGQTTIGTTAAMKGIILCQTAIVLNTGATLEGRALAQTAVTMDANIVGVPGTPVPEFSQVLIPFVGVVLVVALVSRVRNQRK